MSSLQERLREHLDVNEFHGPKVVLYEHDLDVFTGGEILELIRTGYLEQVGKRKWLTGPKCDAKRCVRFSYVVQSVSLVDDIPTSDACVWRSEGPALRHGQGLITSWMRIAITAGWAPRFKHVGRYTYEIIIDREAEGDFVELHGSWIQVRIKKLPYFEDDEDYQRAAEQL